MCEKNREARRLLAENKNKINLLAENKNRTFTKFENLQNPARARRVGRHAKSNVLKTRAPLQELQCYSRAASAAPAFTNLECRSIMIAPRARCTYLGTAVDTKFSMLSA